MRRVQPKWLIQAFGLAGLAYGLAQAGVPMAAQAQARVQRTEVSVDSKRTEPTERVEATDLPPSRTYIGNPAQACANQSEAVALERIAGCAKLIESGRLKGKPLGVAYSLRGLAFLDRGDVPHAIADLNRAVDLAPDFPPAYQNRGNAWFARGNYGQAIADYDATIKLDPEDPSPYVNRAAVRRDLGFTDGALEDYQKAIRFICARKSIRAPSPTSTAPCGSIRATAITCCAAKPAKETATSTARCTITRKLRASIPKASAR